jgi:hypothetical protein
VIVSARLSHASSRRNTSSSGIVTDSRLRFAAKATEDTHQVRRLAVMVLLVLAGCGPIESAQVKDQINGMIGFSQEHVLSCMGPPTSTARVGETESWSYITDGPITSSTFVSGNRSFMAGSTTTSQEACVVNLTMRHGLVEAASYRSRGKLLAPSLPCYTLLQACVPNPTAVSSVSDRTKEATASCKKLYEDHHLDPLRGVIALGDLPTLEMQSNGSYISDSQKPALDVLKSVSEQCRKVIAAANPRLWQIVVEVSPDPSEHMRDLYNRSITIGQYNTWRQETHEKLNKALAAAAKQQ